MAHSDLPAEQAYVDEAYEQLEAARVKQVEVLGSFKDGVQGGTRQARVEFESVLDDTEKRLQRLDIGERSLVFGRIELDEDDDDDNGTDATSAGADNGADATSTGADDSRERLYIGRVGLWNDVDDAIVIDWRAPIAEAYYRATGVEPHGVRHRRRFTSRGKTLIGIEDELFGDKALIGYEVSDTTGEMRRRDRPISQALEAALEAPRTGQLGDIVATIQGEQDEVIRADRHGVLVVYGGPGTGKTVVGLHRASYLLYTHRFPLEKQGVLIVGPSRVFLGYIEQVLPSLGTQVGVELAVIADLLRPRVRVGSVDQPHVARVKGDPRMAKVMRRAVRDRQRPLREELVVNLGSKRLRLSVEQSKRIVTAARAKFKKHNAARGWVTQEVYYSLLQNAGENVTMAYIKEHLEADEDLLAALDWMWPVLTHAEVLNDLFGSQALLESAGRNLLSDNEIALLRRDRQDALSQVRWTLQDVALLDELRALLGFRPDHENTDTIEPYGHIVIDEAQDVSPMELRMLARRSIGGSMTVVGDLAQATAAWPYKNWDELLTHLPTKRGVRKVELQISYRIPEKAMTLANRVLPHAAPGAEPPLSVRPGGHDPRIVECTSASNMVKDVASTVRSEIDSIGEGNLAVIVPSSLFDPVGKALRADGHDLGEAGAPQLRQQVTLVRVRLAKGLEMDSVVVVEPALIVSEESRGNQSLYVALTRATQRVTVVHSEPLPEFLRL